MRQPLITWWYGWAVGRASGKFWRIWRSGISWIALNICPWASTCALIDRVSQSRTSSTWWTSTGNSATGGTWNYSTYPTTRTRLCTIPSSRRKPTAPPSSPGSINDSAASMTLSTSCRATIPSTQSQSLVQIYFHRPINNRNLFSLRSAILFLNGISITTSIRISSQSFKAALF